MTDGRPPEEESSLVTMARLSGHGLTLALATGLFLLLGWWADGRLGTTPLLTIVGALIGAAAGFYSMLQHLILIPREAEARREKDGTRVGGDAPTDPED
jgi:F0F1-type ATP synthase assembly protein I